MSVNDYEDFEEEDIVKESVIEPLLKKENAKTTRDNEQFGKHAAFSVIAQPLLFIPILAALVVAAVSPFVNKHMNDMVDQVLAGSINSYFADVELEVISFSQSQVNLKAGFEILHGGKTLEFHRQAGSSVELLDGHISIASFGPLKNEEWSVVDSLDVTGTGPTGTNNVTIPLKFFDRGQDESQVDSDVARPFWHLLFSSRQTRSWDVASVIDYKLSMDDGTEVAVMGEYHLTALPMQGFGDMSADLAISSLILDGDGQITLTGVLTGKTRSNTRVNIDADAPIALCYSETMAGMRSGVVVYDDSDGLQNQDTLEACVPITMPEGFIMSQSIFDGRPFTVTGLSISSRILGCLLSPIADVGGSCKLELRPVPGNVNQQTILEETFVVPIHRSKAAPVFEIELPVIDITAGTQSAGRFGAVSSAVINIRSTLKSIETLSNRQIERLSVQPSLSTIDPMYDSFRFSVTDDEALTKRNCYFDGSQAIQPVALHYQLNSNLLPSGSVEYTPSAINEDSCARMLYPAMCCRAQQLGRSSVILDILMGMKFKGIDQELASEQPSMRVACNIEDFDVNSACSQFDFGQ
eukprot:Clim_evm2s233 gene=Clim_evmTU2s233